MTEPLPLREQLTNAIGLSPQHVLKLVRDNEALFMAAEETAANLKILREYVKPHIDGPESADNGCDCEKCVARRIVWGKAKPPKSAADAFRVVYQAMMAGKKPLDPDVRPLLESLRVELSALGEPSAHKVAMLIDAALGGSSEPPMRRRRADGRIEVNVQTTVNRELGMVGIQVGDGERGGMTPEQARTLAATLLEQAGKLEPAPAEANA